MDKKEIAEIRGILGGRRCVIDKIGGCFAGEDGEIILDLDETFLALPDEEQAKYMCSKWRERSQEIYAYLIRRLMGN